MTLSIHNVTIVKVDESRRFGGYNMSNEKALSLNQDSFVIGLKQTTKALLKHDVQSLIIARDVDIHILSKVLTIAFETGVPISYSPSRQILGSHYGIEVNATVVALLK